MRLFIARPAPSASPASLAARDMRVTAARLAALALAARRARYMPDVYGYAAQPFHTFDRPRICTAPNAGRDVSYA